MKEPNGVVRRRVDNADIEKKGDLGSPNAIKGAREAGRSIIAHRIEKYSKIFLSKLTPQNLAKLCLLLFVLLMMHKNDIILGRRGFIVKRVTNINRQISQTQFYLHFWTYVSPGAYASWLKAKQYYESQRPMFEKAASSFEVHPYWLRTEIDRVDAGWYEMISLRAKAMADMFDESGRDDFKIEKDKCEMYRFFTRNKFRTATIFGYWDDYEKFTRDLFADKAIPANATWPVFFKCCHLTQGSSESTRMLKSKDWVHKNEKEMTAFIKEKWIYRADDWERPWAKHMNKLTDSLIPGIMVQGPFSTSWEDMSREPKVVELKVETFWGRAYLASANFGRDTIILRDGSIEVYPTWWQNKVNAHTESPYNTWIREEGHLERVWKLAETAAKIMGIDQVRIDIFIKKGDPDAITINENSISSGMGYRSHFEFMPKIWAEGHVEKWYKEYKGPAKDTPVYELSYPDKKCPNYNQIDIGPPYIKTA
mmetsp:Transcript_1502/g.2062  ORF Transcript_1502/g.2062 Transcript_1502/m.2062 type:complete len:480 (-) Transcript_1502:137-1576(-)|eukprot:CAMPEP_0184496070 /NCGR_PEP_ID=MMETSP0113_2-20130426/33054_1 /TAXON_ID=91329 /ORGANISM="Norrisiella sphaerica, Strain BC52" /LENGTH=479 /DNA_ID=CAMNT_0026882557 /DNA_START=26 /DNA_END=1465 /DNA_ORIENTATION=-